MQDKEKRFRTVIIDGTNFFIRYFSADSQTIDEFGMPCGGLTGTLKGLRNIIQELKPNEIIMVFDGKDNSQRKQKIDEQYKQGKRYSFIELLPQENRNLFNKQMAKLLLMLKYLPIKVFAVSNVEADDVIGYITYILNKRDEPLDKFIVSVDADFQQLLSNDTFIYNPQKKSVITSEGFAELNKFNAQNFHIFKTFAGEGKNRDNVPRIFTKRKIMGYFEDLLNSKESVSLTELEDYIKQQNIPVDIDRVRKNFNLVNLHTPNISNDAKIQIAETVNNYETKVYNILSFQVQLKTFGIQSKVYGDIADYFNLYKLKNNAYTKYFLEKK